MNPTESNQHPEAVRAARRLLLSRTHGILSTLSRDLDGYPFGSVAPFCLDGDGSPVILISNIAEHTRNLESDSRASLIVTEIDDGDVQALGRITLVGDFLRLAEPDPRTVNRYFRYFPASRAHHETLGFAFYRMNAKQARYIGGFGAIHWLEPERVLIPNPFTAGQEASIVDHMNADHVDAMRKYCRRAGITVPPGTAPAMAGVDADGFDLLVGKAVHRIVFEAPATNPAQVRRALVAMAREDDQAKG